MKTISAAKPSIFAIASFCIATAVPVSAFAQSATETAPEADQGVDTIIVTAQRRAENIQDVPISMTAVSGDQLLESGANSSEALQRIAPGLTVASVGSGFVSYTYIRGAGTNQLDPGSDPSVAYFVDEVYLGGTAGLQFDLFDIDHVEVLKGPQGTLFGRNAAAGAISIVTKRPSDQFGGNISLRYGNYSALTARGSVTGPLTEDGRLAFRLSGVYRRRDGYTENLTGGKDPGGIDTGGARGQLQWKGDNVTVLVTGDYLRGRNGMTNQFLFSPNVAAFVDPTLPQPTDQSTYRHYYNVDGFENQDMRTLTGRIEVDTGIGTITSLSSYRSNKFRRLQDQDSTLYDGQALSTYEYDRTFSQELRLTGDAGPVSYVAGLYYYHSNVDFSYFVDTGPAYQTVAQRGRNILDDSHIVIDSYAAFGQASIDFTDQLKLTVGGRYTQDKKKDDRTVDRFQQLVYSVNVKAKFQDFTPAITLQYTPSNDLMFYASYREGFKSGGFQTLAPASALIASTPFLPEYVKSYEAGMKGTFLDNSLRTNIALFRADVQNQQISRALPTNSIQIDNAGSTRAQGVDLMIEARPAANLSFIANMTYQHARFRQFISGANDFSGNNQLRSPDFTGYFAVRYGLPIGEAGTLNLQAEYSERSRAYFDPANTKGRFFNQPAFGLGNLRASFEPTDSGLTVAAYVNNVGNKHYFINMNVNNQSSNVVPGEPRTYGVELNYRF